ncbi:hypothetical protein [Acidiphilium sp. 37-64-53]|uniref:hypothetical protein n=2 Tax=Acidocellaceae TaxID=3385905 RepID=UPI00257B3446|nr:hypothetical protein [Acidiphilium sp. 37-64-53]
MGRQSPARLMTTPNRSPDFTPATIARFTHLGLPTETISPWLDQQLSRRTDPDFAALFADHIDLPGIHPADYLHKIIPTPSGDLLGGIRFYGQHITKPFVELLAWTGPIDLPAWRTAITAAWSRFNPTQFRVLATNQPDFAGAVIDQSIHVGRAGVMAETPTTPRVALQPCPNPADAAAEVAAWYDAFAADHPTVAAELHPADTAELAACHADGTLDFITIDGAIAGLIATEPGPIDWLHGHVMIEEILAPAHRGRGIAAQAQRLLAARLATTHGSDTLITGTIQRLNIASHRAATNAGRPAIMDYRFLPLG